MALLLFAVTKCPFPAAAMPLCLPSEMVDIPCGLLLPQPGLLSSYGMRKELHGISPVDAVARCFKALNSTPSTALQGVPLRRLKPAPLRRLGEAAGLRWGATLGDGGAPLLPRQLARLAPQRQKPLLVRLRLGVRPCLRLPCSAAQLPS